MSNPLMEPTRVIIPVDVAIAKTTYWRNFVRKTFSQVTPENLPKGVFISRQDIMDLAEYCKADETMLGVRTYFTLENEFDEDAENQVKFIMVLVKDVPGYYNGQDQLYVPAGAGMEALSPDGGDLDDSNVYDFTQPCPDCCDPDSQLFSLQPAPPLRKKK